MRFNRRQFVLFAFLIDALPCGIFWFNLQGYAVIYKIKRGVTFRIKLTFSADQWSALYPWVGIDSALRQGWKRTAFAVNVDAPSRTVTLAMTPEQTSLLAVGVPAEIDVWVDRGRAIVAVPYSSNVTVNVIDGATQ